MAEIRMIEPHEADEARRVMLEVCLTLWPEIFQGPEDILRLDQLLDIVDPQKYYFAQGGTFLVTVEDGKIIGTGAVRRLETEICELRRMWLLPPFHGRGLGKRMAEELLRFAREAGYQKVRLDTYDGSRQGRALKLYENLGFTYIPRYNDGICSIFMEKQLTP